MSTQLPRCSQFKCQLPSIKFPVADKSPSVLPPAVPTPPDIPAAVRTPSLTRPLTLRTINPPTPKIPHIKTSSFSIPTPRTPVLPNIGHQLEPRTPILPSISQSTLRAPGLPSISQSTPRAPVLPSISQSTPRMVLRKLQPPTPMAPKIGTIKRPTIAKLKTKEDEEINPWIPPRVDVMLNIRNIALTPIGTVARVPTLSHSVPITPRRYPVRMEPPPEPDTQVLQPILDASIYLDLTKTEDQPYNYVKDHMRNISDKIMQLQKQYKNILIPLPCVSGRVSKKKFEEMLNIYENNQVYYQDQIDDKTMDIETIKTKLSELEFWFMAIIEPKSRDEPEEWEKREKRKLEKGISIYCDPELYSYISPLPLSVRQFIEDQHKILF